MYLSIHPSSVYLSVIKLSIHPRHIYISVSIYIYIQSTYIRVYIFAIYLYAVYLSIYLFYDSTLMHLFI